MDKKKALQEWCPEFQVVSTLPRWWIFGMRVSIFNKLGLSSKVKMQRLFSFYFMKKKRKHISKSQAAVLSPPPAHSSTKPHLDESSNQQQSALASVYTWNWGTFVFRLLCLEHLQKQSWERTEYTAESLGEQFLLHHLPAVLAFLTARLTFFWDYKRQQQIN